MTTFISTCCYIKLPNGPVLEQARLLKSRFQALYFVFVAQELDTVNGQYRAYPMDGDMMNLSHYIPSISVADELNLDKLRNSVEVCLRRHLQGKLDDGKRLPFPKRSIEEVWNIYVYDDECVEIGFVGVNCTAPTAAGHLKSLGGADTSQLESHPTWLCTSGFE